MNGTMNENNPSDPCSSSSSVMNHGLEKRPAAAPPASPTTLNNENGQSKVLKRKVVSFSTMPFEKKIADGKISFSFDRLIDVRMFQFTIAFVTCKKAVIFSKFAPTRDNSVDFTG